MIPTPSSDSTKQYEQVISGDEEPGESAEITEDPTPDVEDNESELTRRELFSGVQASGDVMEAVDEGLVEQTEEDVESDEPTLDDVPDEYWDTLRERTGFVKQDVEDLEQLEELLSDRQFERLKSKIQ